MGWQGVFGDGVVEGLSHYSGLTIFTIPIFCAALFPVLLHQFWGKVYEAPILYPLLPSPPQTRAPLMPTPAGSAHAGSQTNLELSKQLQTPDLQI